VRRFPARINEQVLQLRIVSEPAFLLKDWLLITIAFALGFQTVHLISFQCLHRKLRWALLERATASCSATELPPNVAFIQLMHEKTIIIPKFHQARLPV